MLSIHPRLGLDCGSYRLRLLRMGKPDIREDLNVVALIRRGPDRSQKILAIGSDALEASRALPPGDVELVWPVAGTVHDYIVCETSLMYYGRAIVGPFLKPIVIAAIPAGCSEAAKRAMYDSALLGMHAHEVYMVEDLLVVAASVGADYAEKPRLLLQIGAGVTTVGVTMGGNLAHVRMLSVAGNYLDIAIHRRLWDRLDRHVDLLTCRELKHAVGALGSATARDILEATLRDREGAELDLDQATPLVHEALEHGLVELVEEIRWFLRELPDDLWRSAEQSSMLLAGGTANLPGLDNWLADRLELNIARHPHPDRACIEGIQQILPRFVTWPRLRRELRDRRTH